MRERLEALSELYGVETGYHDINGGWHGAQDEHLLHVLALVGAPIDGADGLEEAIHGRQWSEANRILPWVQVCWEGESPRVRLRVLDMAASGPFVLHMTDEAGTTRRVDGRLEDLTRLEARAVDGETYVDLGVDIDRPAFGYHDLTLELGRAHAHGRLISAPATTYAPEGDRQWGLFAPAYALRTQSDRGVGHFGHLRRLTEQLARAGGDVVGTLPLTATFLDSPYEPSPYVPVSRLFWNELFLDLARLPEFGGAEPRRMHAGAAFEETAADLRAHAHARHGEAYALIEPILDACAREAWSSSAADEIRAWMRRRPRAEAYAKFRALTRHRGVWHTWSEAERSGALPDVDPDRVRTHLYAQFRLDQQLGELGAPLRERGGGLYLDLPLGVHPDGFDAWSEKSVFIHGVSAGAPPDALAPEGQDWGFRPMHPDGLRQSGHRYFIDIVRRQAEIAAVLRIDHVMGLHRIFCVPWKFGAAGGTYVRCPADELWAVVCVESNRHRCRVVGEDLGTVPDAVRERLARHRVQRMYVTQFEMEPDPSAALRAVPEHATCSINTHDTPSFLGFWEHRDIRERVERGITTEEQAAGEHAHRNQLQQATVDYLRRQGALESEVGPMDVLVALLVRLASSDCPLVLVNLEDLWLEPEPQNVPGTKDERPNWSRRTRLTLDQIEDSPELSQLFETLRTIRNPS